MWSKRKNNKNPPEVTEVVEELEKVTDLMKKNTIQVEIEMDRIKKMVIGFEFKDK